MTFTLPNSASANLREHEQVLRSQVFDAVREYYQYKFAEQPFVAGKTYIRNAGKVFDEHELLNLIDASLDFWLTTGRYATQFEQRFAEWMGVKHCVECPHFTQVGRKAPETGR
jgi:CDP-4-dehydro-6-deoxyglucose reductase, E1